MKLEENQLKKAKRYQANSGEPLKHKLIFHTHGLLSFKLELNQEAQYLTNLMLKDETT